MVEVPEEGESCPKTVFRQQKSRTTGSGSFRFRNPVSGVNFLLFLIMNFQTRSGAFEDCFNIIWKNLFMNGTYVPRNTTPLMPYAIFFFSFGTHMPTITPMANRQNFNSARVSQLLQQYSSAASNNFIRFFSLKLFSIVCFL